MCNCHNNVCNYGCYEVAEIIYNKKYESIVDAISKNKSVLNNYQAFKGMANTWKYPHHNFSLIFYCIDINHISCIEKCYVGVLILK